MRHVKRLGRLGVLAVGLGIGAAVASTGTASADTSADPFSWIAGLDPGDLSAAATPAPSTLDFQISIDGFDLFPTAGNTATATSGMGDIAIAFGSGSHAIAVGGFGDEAFADGSAAQALAGGPTTGAADNFDFASATGDSSFVVAGNTGLDPDTIGSSFDFGSASGVGSIAVAGGNGSGDVASAVGQDVISESGRSSNATDPANYDYASAIGNNTTPTSTEAIAGGGLSDLGGSNDFASVSDPSGTVGSTADAGLGFNSDLAAAFGDAFNAIATGGENLFDILGLS
jgi:hypothetical protein